MDTMEALNIGEKDNPMIAPKESPGFPEVKIDELLPTETLLENDLEGDDDCVICYQTLYRPVKTICNHAACESCMLHWALSAMTTATTSELPSNLGLSVEGIRFKCPTCRTWTEAHFDHKLDSILSTKYPEEYAARAAEESALPNKSQPEDGVESMIVMLGNSHQKIEPYISPHSGKTCEHEWTFFVQTSRQEVIDQVEVILHPSFREGRLVLLKEPPFSTTQRGWGYFTVYAGIRLKAGYQWVGENRAVDTDTKRQRINDRLPFEWYLDFNGTGSQRNRIVKFKKVEQQQETAVDSEDEEDDLDALTDLMSATELAELRATRRLKRAAERSVAE